MNVLLLCTGNSARSIIGEALLNHLGQGRFTAFSAGSFPKGQVHPLALETLQRHHIATAGLRSKSWDEFAVPDAPTMHFSVTVCDNAAREVCPVWPGHPVTAHWSLVDPAAVAGTADEQRAAFERTFRELEERIKEMTPSFSRARRRSGGRSRT